LQSKPAEFSCATLAGDIVVNCDDDELGAVRHVMIDVASGRVAYAVLGIGGVFGIGEMLLPVPWRALQVDGERDALILDIAPARLEAAPRFAPHELPSLDDPDQARAIAEFYGVA
jgi:hypothetical protein